MGGLTVLEDFLGDEVVIEVLDVECVGTDEGIMCETSRV